MTPDQVIRWTIWIAMAALCFAWWWELSRSTDAADESSGALASRSTSSNIRRVRWAHLIGWSAFVAHVCAAFHYVHRWSHLHAVDHTARIAAQVTGISAWYGIYFNYLFLAVWTCVLGSWWRARVKRDVVEATRRDGIDGCVRLYRWSVGYMAFMVVQGGVFFAPSSTAVVVAVALGMLAWRWIWLSCRPRRRSMKPTQNESLSRRRSRG